MGRCREGRSRQGTAPAKVTCTWGLRNGRVTMARTEEVRERSSEAGGWTRRHFLSVPPRRQTRLEDSQDGLSGTFSGHCSKCSNLRGLRKPWIISVWFWSPDVWSEL